MATSLFQVLVVIKLLESREIFSSDRVDTFQLQCVEFGDIFFALTGRDGMTNYFHILRSGHFSYFLWKYGNIYLLSQQGWENVNGTYKRTLHNNTQKGGGIGGSSNMYTLLWRYGYLDKLFAKLGHTDAIGVKYGKVKGLRTQTAATDAATKLFAKTILKFGIADEAVSFWR